MNVGPMSGGVHERKEDVGVGGKNLETALWKTKK